MVLVSRYYSCLTLYTRGSLTLKSVEC
uniref:Uncharacterized protein n=1 Tax=Anguilla anguilla TaxID=7936 RepID=A0A0E9PN21_ANGAN